MADPITYRNVLLLDDDENGLIPYITPATQSKLGTVKVGTGLSVTVDGTISYTLPAASASTLGGIKVGNNLSIENGVLSAQAGGSSRNLGEIITSSTPQIDAGLHEMDGSVVSSGGVYDDFIQYMADLYEDDPTNPIFAQAETLKEYNCVTFGPCSEVNGILSHFKDSTGFATVQVKNPTTSMELVVKIRRSTLIDGRSFIHVSKSGTAGIVLRAHASGAVHCYMGATQWNICNNLNTNLPLSAGIWTWYKVTWNGTTYTFWKSIDGENWVKGNTVTSSVAVKFSGDDQLMNLGGTTWEGYAWMSAENTPSAEIDLNGCYMKVDGTFAADSSVMTGGTLAWSGVTEVSYSAQDIYDRSIQRYGVCRQYVRIPRYYAWYTPNGAYGKTNPRLTTTENPPEHELMHEYVSGGQVGLSDMEYVHYVDGQLYITGYYGTFPAVRYPAADYYGTSPSIRLPKSASNDRYLIDSQYSTTNWYRIYSDGWCEQGGSTHGVTGNYNVVLPIPYLTDEYLVIQHITYSANNSLNNRAVFNQSNTQFSIYSDYAYPMYWTTQGYVDISNYKIAPLYEYVTLATVQKAPAQVVIDNVIEDLNNKVDKTDLQTVQCVIEEYHNGESWYRLWSDGFLEQGGKFALPALNTWYTVFLFKPYLADSYTVTFGCTELLTTAYPDTFGGCRYKTPRSFQIGARYHSSGTVSVDRYVMWYTCGYVA